MNWSSDPIPLEPHVMSRRWPRPAGLLRWVARRCDVHDRPSEAKIAALEVAAGIDPLAEERMWEAPLLHRFDDPDLIDCGRAWCRANRGLP